MSKARQRSGRAQTARWADLPEEDLLELPLKNLKVRPEGTWLADCLRDVNAELKARGIGLKMHGWLSDEWFSPTETPGVAFPFYHAHPRLRRLERKMMLEVEGGTRRECLQLLRHEAGHVVEYAFALHKKKRFQRLFGRANDRYSDRYRADPNSKAHVQHLRRWYAQCHPDEDFAETFAVWLTPRSGWKKRYAQWPKALEKLEYIDEMMAELADQKPLPQKRFEVDALPKLKGTLREHYDAKRKRYAVMRRTCSIASCGRCFRKMCANPTRYLQVQSFVRIARRSFGRWRSERARFPLALDAAIDDMITRSKALKLRSPRAEQTVRAEITAMLSSKAIHTHNSTTRRHWFAV